MDFWTWLATVLSAEKAPWWGIPGVTATATILGAAVAYLSTRASDRRKTKIEDRRRWDQDVRKHGAEFLSAVDEYIDALDAFQRRFRADGGKFYITRDEATDRLMPTIHVEQARVNTAKVTIREALSHLSFLAPRALNESAGNLSDFAMGRDRRNRITEEFMNEYQAVRQEVVVELRKAIKVVER
ncbi:hypothetical protein J2X12_004119 [Pseudarthrobacter oxydans]|uniref:Uncharacterized protein n=1 Tax=Pseudarthrobacter oxydans TaxID=1671 RepID=A0AAW8NGQ8_PSEOX|nr:hypothetical protein [Pseudarthrobacter oxydans]MDR6794733.1 hypothetical protein [Pseudarthrobacter oxydans]MDR7166065.1 hypothetical protein [Pseudarthrobacter oxydans]